MAAYGRPALRDLFDGAPTPHIAHPPETHHRDFYLATDGSFRESGGGLGVLIETRDGTRVTRLSVPRDSPDNNVAECRALRLGLNALATRSPPGVRVGVLLDHDQLAAKVNASVLAAREAKFSTHHQVSVPGMSDHHWQEIRTCLRDFGEVRAARIASDHNPAHPLANAPEKYAHVNDEPDRCVRPQTTTTEERIPPPSRSDRGASD
jgi:ribonuclease HI